MARARLDDGDTGSINVSKRIALITAILLLLGQAFPALACVAMPAQGLSACCCEPDRACPMRQSANQCGTADACCVQLTGSNPSLSGPAANADEPTVAHPIVTGAPPLADALFLVGQQASRVAVHLQHHRTTPPPAVPLYLLHLRLTL